MDNALIRLLIFLLAMQPIEGFAHESQRIPVQVLGHGSQGLVGPILVRCSLNQIANQTVWTFNLSSCASSGQGTPQVGDMALAFWGGGYLLTYPTVGCSSGSGNWSAEPEISGGNWSGFLCYTTFASSDISTGTVTLTARGAFWASPVIVILQGAPSAIREVDTNAANATGSGGPETQTFGSSTAVLTTDTAFIFCSNRNPSLPTVSLGTVITSSPSLPVGSGDASATITRYIPTASGAFSATCSYPATDGSSGGYVIAIWIFEHY